MGARALLGRFRFVGGDVLRPASRVALPDSPGGRTPIILLAGGLAMLAWLGAGSMGAGPWMQLGSAFFLPMALVAPVTRRRRSRPAVEAAMERWVALGERDWAEQLDRALGQRGAARVVGTLELPPGGVRANYHEALGTLRRVRADRVVLPPQFVTSQVLDLVASCRSLGVQVNLITSSAELIRNHVTASKRPGHLTALDIGEIVYPSRGGRSLANRDRSFFTGQASPRVSVVIPARNEARNIPYVFSRMPEAIYEVILVDGHSTDGTIDAAIESYPEICIVAQSGFGKGDALRAGFAAATGDIIVTLDADGSADPAEIPRYVESLASCDFAKGSRFIDGGGSEDITLVRRLGNRALCAAVNRLYATGYSDLCYGYNAFWAECLPYLALDCDGFEVETLLNIRAASSCLRVAEVPSYESKRLHGKSNLRTFRDGFRVLSTIGRERPDPRVPEHATLVTVPLERRRQVRPATRRVGRRPVGRRQRARRAGSELPFPGEHLVDRSP